MKEQTIHPFINFLIQLRDDENEAKSRAALATLRRGLGKEPNEAREVFPYIFPFLPADAPAYVEKPYFVIGALFALHPGERQQEQVKGNMGRHFAIVLAKEREEAKDPEFTGESIERRFTMLLNAHADELPIHLRQAISYLRNKEVQVNWPELFHDVRYWRDPATQKRWARQFWGKSPAKDKAEESSNLQ